MRPIRLKFIVSLRISYPVLPHHMTFPSSHLNPRGRHQSKSIDRLFQFDTAHDALCRCRSQGRCAVEESPCYLCAYLPHLHCLHQPPLPSPTLSADASGQGPTDTAAATLSCIPMLLWLPSSPHQWGFIPVLLWLPSSSMGCCLLVAPYC